jgi:hypothetical protein
LVIGDQLSPGGRWALARFRVGRGRLSFGNKNAARWQSIWREALWSAAVFRRFYRGGPSGNNSNLGVHVALLPFKIKKS